MKMYYRPIFDGLQNLIKDGKITHEYLASYFNSKGVSVTGGSLRSRYNRNGYLNDRETVIIKQYENELLGNENCNTNDIFNSNDTFCPYRMENNCPCKEQFEIQYIECLPEEAKLPEITSIHVDTELVENHWRRKRENLRIIPMQGDSLSNYFYPCQNRDILIVDISSIVPAREGLYLYSAHNNTMLFVAKLSQSMDGTIKIEKFEANGEVAVKTVPVEKQKEVDFRVLGRIVKNVSLTL